MVGFNYWSQRQNASVRQVDFVSWRLTRYPRWEELLPLVERTLGQLELVFTGEHHWERYQTEIAYHVNCARKCVRPDPKVFTGACSVTTAGAEHYVAMAASLTATLRFVAERDEQPYGWCCADVPWYLEHALGCACWAESGDLELAKANYRARMAVVFGDLVELGEPVPEVV